MNSFSIDKSQEASFAYSKAVIKYYAKSFSFASMFLPKPRRLATYAVYGFCRFVDNIVDSVRSRSESELKKELDCFREELITAYRNGESQHPVLSPFIHTALFYNIPLEEPLELIKGVEMDFSIKRYDTFDELYVFCYRVASVVGLMMSRVFGISDEKYLLNAEQLGIAMQLTNILRDVKEDKDMGRIYLPKEELDRFDISENDVIDENFGSKFREMMQFQIHRAYEYYEKGNSGIKSLDKDCRFAVASASDIYSEILKKLVEQDYNPFISRAAVSKSRKIFLLGKSYLKYKFSNET